MSDFVPIQEIVLNSLNAIEEAAKTKGRVTGIATGFTELDYKLTGLHRQSSFWSRPDRPWERRRLSLNIAQYAAFKDNHAVAMFSLEMSKEQLVTRLMASESMVDSQQIRTGDLRDSDWEKLLEGAALIGNSKLIIDDTASSLAEIRSKCRKYKQTYDIDMVVIDYLQLMSGSNTRRNESRQQEISEISRALKVLARELNIPIIALSQLSVRWKPDRITGRCFRTCVSQEPSSRMPTWSCSCTGMNTIIRTQKKRISRRSLWPSREKRRHRQY